MLSLFLIRLRTLFVLALAVGVVVSANSRTVSHNFIELAEIIAQHDAAVDDHGHSHEDIIDIIHAAHEHAHEIAEHDHNIAFLPPRQRDQIIPFIGQNWSMMNTNIPDPINYSLDRPPRV